MNKAMMTALIVLMFTGCTAQSIKPDQKLAVNEGILVTTVECSMFDRPFWIEFYASGHYSKGYVGGLMKAGSSGCDPEKHVLRTISLPEGSYFVGKIGHQNYVDIPESDAIMFRIEAGKLNYIGDLRIFSAPEARKILVDIQVMDNEASASGQLASDYPWLKGTYPWVKSLATDPRHGSP